MSDEDVTVLVATRNRPNELKRCLESIFASSHRRFRVIVVDQSDNDETRIACAAACDRRLDYVKDNGAGLSRARNLGIAAISGGIVAMTDDDCVVARDWLERLVQSFEENPDCMLAFGNFVAAPHDWRKDFIPSVMFERESVLNGRRYRFLSRGCGGNMAARRELFARVGGFDERLGAGAHFHSSEDRDMHYRTCAAGLTTMEMPGAEVEHWGARSLLTGEAQRLQRNSAFGTGARLAKAFRCGDHKAAAVLARKVADRLVTAARNLRAGKRPAGATQIPYVLLGFARGLAAPIDSQLCVFQPGPDNTAERYDRVFRECLKR